MHNYLGGGGGQTLGCSTLLAVAHTILLPAGYTELDSDLHYCLYCEQNSTAVYVSVVVELYVAGGTVKSMQCKSPCVQLW